MKAATASLNIAPVMYSILLLNILGHHGAIEIGFIIIITIIIIINTKQHSGLTSYFSCTVLLHLGRRRPEPSGGTEGARFWSGGTGEARAESRSPKGRGRAGGVVLGEGSQPLPHQLGVLGECCKLPSVVRSGAPAAEGFSCVLYVVQLLRIEGTAGATCFSKW